MQKEINLPSGDYIFCLIPDDAKDFRYDSWFIRYVNYDSGGIRLDVHTTIISTTNDITEEQCENLIDKPEYGWYLTYTKGNNDSYHCQTAKESLQSLIQSVGLDLKLNYLILKKI